MKQILHLCPKGKKCHWWGRLIVGTGPEKGWSKTWGLGAVPKVDAKPTPGANQTAVDVESPGGGDAGEAHSAEGKDDKDGGPKDNVDLYESGAEGDGENGPTEDDVAESESEDHKVKIGETSGNNGKEDGQDDKSEPGQDSGSEIGESPGEPESQKKDEAPESDSAEGEDESNGENEQPEGEISDRFSLTKSNFLD
jgi:hypothetical protein